MAFINLLKSSFEGKLGEAYGVKQYGKHFAKAIPFSHSPFTEKQKKAFSAFALLQKFAAGQWRAMKKNNQIAKSKTVATEHHKQVVKEKKTKGWGVVGALAVKVDIVT